MTEETCIKYETEYSYKERDLNLAKVFYQELT
jgi:hypothetical protein